MKQAKILKWVCRMCGREWATSSGLHRSKFDKYLNHRGIHHGNETETTDVICDDCYAARRESILARCPSASIHRSGWACPTCNFLID